MSGRKRRVKLFLVQEDEIVRLLAGWKFGDHARLRKCANVPADARILGVNYDHMRRGFVVAVEHETFDEQPEGLMLPIEITNYVEVAMQEGEA